MQQIGFDLISDLYLEPGQNFDWTGKATSLYCVIAGNISSDLETIGKVLQHLSNFYQGVFYTLGSLEYKDMEELIDERTDEILTYCDRFRKVAVLHQNVVIVDGIAILGVNGWYGNTERFDLLKEAAIESKRYEDLGYLKNSIERLQKHLDVKNILIVTNSVPGDKLYFGEVPAAVIDQMQLESVLFIDTEKKVKHWAFGTHGKIVDSTLNGINYFSNPKLDKNPYWAKRITIEV